MTEAGPPPLPDFSELARRLQACQTREEKIALLHSVFIKRPESGGESVMDILKDIQEALARRGDTAMWRQATRILALMGELSSHVDYPLSPEDRAWLHRQLENLGNEGEH